MHVYYNIHVQYACSWEGSYMCSLPYYILKVANKDVAISLITYVYDSTVLNQLLFVETFRSPTWYVHMYLMIENMGLEWMEESKESQKVIY